MLEYLQGSITEVVAADALAATELATVRCTSPVLASDTGRAISSVGLSGSRAGLDRYIRATPSKKCLTMRCIKDQ